MRSLRAINGNYFFLGSYLLIALGMVNRVGSYTPLAVTFLVLGFLCLIFGIINQKDKVSDSSLIITFIGLSFISLTHEIVPVPLRLIWNIASLLIASGLLIAEFLKLQLRLIVISLGLIVGVGMQFAVPIVSKSPKIDVFSVSQESASALLKGLNPYSVSISDPAHGDAPFGYTVEHYFYTPANLIVQTISYAVTHDVRYALIFANLITILCIYVMGRKRLSREQIGLIALLFLFHPWQLFGIEQAWTEPMILSAFAIAFALLDGKKMEWAAALFGFAVGFKQYLVCTVLQLFAIERRWKYSLIVFGAIALTFLPFALNDLPTLIEGSLFQLRTPFRNDALTLGVTWKTITGVEPSKFWSLFVSLIATLMTIPWIAKEKTVYRLSLALSVSLFATFLFGAHAFGNYYFLVSGFLLIGLTSRERIPDTASR